MMVMILIFIDTHHCCVIYDGFSFLHFSEFSNIFQYQTLGIQLNTKKLYGADRLAARELLKITTVVYQAIQSMPTTEGDEMHPSPSHHPYPQVSVKVGKTNKEF